MSIDYDALLVDPNYAVHGIAATFVSREGVQADLTIIDKTRGVEVPMGPTMMVGTKPAACVRVSELDANGLDREKMANGRLTFNDRAWNVEKAAAKTVPGGKGEVWLYLQERADG